MTQQISTFLTAVAEFRRRSESCANYAARITREHPHDEAAEHDAILYHGHCKAYREAAEYLERSVDASYSFKEATAIAYLTEIHVTPTNSRRAILEVPNPPTTWGPGAQILCFNDPIQEQPIKVYRVENEKEQKGLWRKFDGTWEPLFDMLTDGKCKDMPMEDNPIYREGGKQWFASAPSKETLQKWFSKRDLEELTAKGFTISEFEVVGHKKISDFEYIFTRDSIISRTYLKVSDIYPQVRPEVDLEKEIERIVENEERFMKFQVKEQLIKYVARHFAEWGAIHLNTRKEK